MPSFDVVSKVDVHELLNAVDQANREIANRFDFRGTNSHLDVAKDHTQLTIIGPTDFHIKQIDEVLRSKLAKRSIDIQVLDYQTLELNNQEAKQVIKIRQGIETDIAKKIVKVIKDADFKVQAAIQSEQVRVTGKKRDDLQAVIVMLRQAKLGLPLQFENFRD